MGLIRAIKHAEIRILVSTFPSCLRTYSDKDTKDEQGINNRMRTRQGKEVNINNNNERKRRGSENPPRKQTSKCQWSRREAATMSALQKPNQVCYTRREGS